MPYRNVYEEKTQHGLISSIDKAELETDPRKIAEIYKSQMPTAEEVEARRKMLNRTNLTTKPGEHNSAEDGRCDRGIRKSILGKSR